MPRKVAPNTGPVKWNPALEPRDERKRRRAEQQEQQRKEEEEKERQRKEEEERAKAAEDALSLLPEPPSMKKKRESIAIGPAETPATPRPNPLFARVASALLTARKKIGDAPDPTETPELVRQRFHAMVLDNAAKSVRASARRAEDELFGPGAPLSSPNDDWDQKISPPPTPSSLAKGGMSMHAPSPWDGDDDPPQPAKPKEVAEAADSKTIAPPSSSDGTPEDEGGPGGTIDESITEVKTAGGGDTISRIEEAVARGAARGLASVQQKPTQQVAQGYAGGRNVLNGDVKNSAASSTGQGAQRGPGQGDAFMNGKESHNTTTDTLRPTFGIAPANGIVPSYRDQVQSDVLFNDFSIVAPGFGLGVTNKMFLMEEFREKNFVFREPLAEPRKYDGPSGLVLAPPLEFQNEITRRDRNTLKARAFAGEASGVLLERRAGDGSLNTLGDDFGMFQRVSDKGLKRPRESPLEPIIRTPKAWERVKPLPGFQWDKKDFRRLFDASRYPERFETNPAMSGGPTMNKRNSLSIFPFPVTSH